MEVLQVVADLVCTRRVEGMQAVSLRVLQSEQGVVSVASDPVGVPEGKWVFVTTGSAARFAMPDPLTITDLAICGIVDHWECAGNAQPAAPDAAAPDAGARAGARAAP